MGSVATAIEDAFRTEWSRVLANLIRFTGNLDLAEECAQEAFARAVEQPKLLAGLENPGAWLTTVAKRIALDRLRREANLARKLPLVAADSPTSVDPGQGSDYVIDDDRLRLVFTACHPDLAEESRVALALRFVCGLSTADIATVFLVSEATMAARITRAKKKIGASGSEFELPGLEQLDERIDAVRTTIYLFYTATHATLNARATVAVDVAISMARHLSTLYPRDPEVAGLLALILLTEARRPGRLSARGEALSLEEVDRTTWNAALVEEGLTLATRALRGGGRFALQAGISGLHSAVASWDQTPWAQIVSLYDRLLEVWPSPSVRLGALVARSYLPSFGPEAALAALDEFGSGVTDSLARQIAATRGDLLRRLDRHREAIAAYDVAIRLEPDPALRGYLLRRSEELAQHTPQS